MLQISRMSSIHIWHNHELERKTKHLKSQNTNDHEKRNFNVVNFYEYQSRCASKITIQRQTKNHHKLQECYSLKCNKNTNPKE